MRDPWHSMYCGHSADVVSFVPASPQPRHRPNSRKHIQVCRKYKLADMLRSFWFPPHPAQGIRRPCPQNTVPSHLCFSSPSNMCGNAAYRQWVIPGDCEPPWPVLHFPQQWWYLPPNFTVLRRTSCEACWCRHGRAAKWQKQQGTMVPLGAGGRPECMGLGNHHRSPMPICRLR